MLQDLSGAVREYGLLGTATLVALGVIKWFDGRIRHVETLSAKTDGRIDEIREDVKWMRDRMENGG